VIQRESVLDVADNSGAKKVKCICVLGGTGRRYANVGDTIVVSVQRVVSKSKINKGDVYRAVVVRTKKGVRRKDGSSITYDSNAVVLTGKQGDLIGTRVFGIISRELRSKGFVKIVSLAAEVV
jgi:large subunit ribosomal protein L14